MSRTSAAAPAQSQAEPHCAHLIAQALVQTGSVPGLWNCMAPSEQQTLSAGGAQPNDGVFAGPTTFSNVRFIYADSAMAIYKIYSGHNKIDEVLVVWLDPNGLILHLGIGRQEI